MKHSKHAKSDALRKKMEEMTDNRCKHCGSKKHSSKEHKGESKLNKKEEREEELEEEEEEKEEE